MRCSRVFASALLNWRPPGFDFLDAPSLQKLINRCHLVRVWLPAGWAADGFRGTSFGSGASTPRLSQSHTRRAQRMERLSGHRCQERQDLLEQVPSESDSETEFGRNRKKKLAGIASGGAAAGSSSVGSSGVAPSSSGACAKKKKSRQKSASSDCADDVSAAASQKGGSSLQDLREGNGSSHGSSGSSRRKGASGARRRREQAAGGVSAKTREGGSCGNLSKGSFPVSGDAGGRPPRRPKRKGSLGNLSQIKESGVSLAETNKDGSSSSCHNIPQALKSEESGADSSPARSEVTAASAGLQGTSSTGSLAEDSSGITDSTLTGGIDPGQTADDERDEEEEEASPWPRNGPPTPDLPEGMPVPDAPVAVKRDDDSSPDAQLSGASYNHQLSTRERFEVDAAVDDPINVLVRFTLLKNVEKMNSPLRKPNQPMKRQALPPKGIHPLSPEAPRDKEGLAIESAPGDTNSRLDEKKKRKKFKAGDKNVVRSYTLTGNDQSVEKILKFLGEGNMMHAGDHGTQNTPRKAKVSQKRSGAGGSSSKASKAKDTRSEGGRGDGPHRSPSPRRRRMSPPAGGALGKGDRLKRSSSAGDVRENEEGASESVSGPLSPEGDEGGMHDHDPGGEDGDSLMSSRCSTSSNRGHIASPQFEEDSIGGLSGPRHEVEACRGIRDESASLKDVALAKGIEPDLDMLRKPNSMSTAITLEHHPIVVAPTILDSFKRDFYSSAVFDEEPMAQDDQEFTTVMKRGRRSRSDHGSCSSTGGGGGLQQPSRLPSSRTGAVSLTTSSPPSFRSPPPSESSGPTISTPQPHPRKPPLLPTPAIPPQSQELISYPSSPPPPPAGHHRGAPPRPLRASSPVQAEPHPSSFEEFPAFPSMDGEGATGATAPPVQNGPPSHTWADVAASRRSQAEGASGSHHPSPPSSVKSGDSGVGLNSVMGGESGSSSSSSASSCASSTTTVVTPGHPQGGVATRPVALSSISDKCDVATSPPPSSPHQDVPLLMPAVLHPRPDPSSPSSSSAVVFHPHSHGQSGRRSRNTPDVSFLFSSLPANNAEMCSTTVPRGGGGAPSRPSKALQHSSHPASAVPVIFETEEVGATVASNDLGILAVKDLVRGLGRSSPTEGGLTFGFFEEEGKKPEMVVATVTLKPSNSCEALAELVHVTAKGKNIYYQPPSNDKFNRRYDHDSMVDYCFKVWSSVEAVRPSKSPSLRATPCPPSDATARAATGPKPTTISA
ncbi:unnamed protein product [Cyprideis torosa]|uniref:Uncharacterized protein n=1 Tax=Cyprideis torosa TaxID=163714 RepID=A0A7R8W865_9CRUS|nr:unnamed protein product [Cyprideis torosa]CAG0885925.1 unnamed protein product [Cyprideis torosa]